MAAPNGRPERASNAPQRCGTPVGPETTCQTLPGPSYGLCEGPALPCPVSAARTMAFAVSFAPAPRVAGVRVQARATRSVRVSRAIRATRGRPLPRVVTRNGSTTSSCPPRALSWLPRPRCGRLFLWRSPDTVSGASARPAPLSSRRLEGFMRPAPVVAEIEPGAGCRQPGTAPAPPGNDRAPGRVRGAGGTARMRCGFPRADFSPSRGLARSRRSWARAGAPSLERRQPSRSGPLSPDACRADVASSATLALRGSCPPHCPSSRAGTSAPGAPLAGSPA